MTLPKLKMPPSEAASQYPPSLGADVMATIGAWSGNPPTDPAKAASP